MKEYKKGERGRIPNWAKERAIEDINKHGFYLAFHYFIYDCDTENLADWEIQYWRAFDQYERTHIIKEQPLTSSSMMTTLANIAGINHSININGDTRKCKEVN